MLPAVEAWNLNHLTRIVLHWCFWTEVLERTLVSSLDSKEITPVNPKGNQHWIFIGRTDAEAPILWPSDVKSQLIGKDPNTGKDWEQEEKGVAEDEMVGWHHWSSRHEFEQTLRDSAGQGTLLCCDSQGCKELDTTWRLTTVTWMMRLWGRQAT